VLHAGAVRCFEQAQEADPHAEPVQENDVLE